MNANKFLIIPENGRISAYLSKEDADYVNENYPIIMGIHDKVPVGQFLVKAVTTAMSIKRPDSNPNDTAEIQKLKKELADAITENQNITNSKGTDSAQLKEEIQKLRTELREKNLMLTELSLDCENIEKQLSDCRHENITFSKEIETLKQKLSLPDGSIIVSLTKAESTIIDYVCTGETERTGKEVTPELLLKNVFAHVIRYGPHDMFKMPIALKKLQELNELSSK